MRTTRIQRYFGVIMLTTAATWGVTANTGSVFAQSTRSTAQPQSSRSTSSNGGSATYGSATASATSQGGQATASSSIQLGSGWPTEQAAHYDGDRAYPVNGLLPGGTHPNGNVPMTIRTTAKGEKGTTIERSQAYQNGKLTRQTVITKPSKIVSVIENEEQGIQVAIKERNDPTRDAKTYFAKDRAELKETEPSIYKWVEKYASDDPQLFPPAVDLTAGGVPATGTVDDQLQILISEMNKDLNRQGLSLPTLLGNSALGGGSTFSSGMSSGANQQGDPMAGGTLPQTNTMSGGGVRVGGNAMSGGGASASGRTSASGTISSGGSRSSGGGTQSFGTTTSRGSASSKK